jgi:hypothetical protein
LRELTKSRPGVFLAKRSVGVCNEIRARGRLLIRRAMKSPAKGEAMGSPEFPHTRMLSTVATSGFVRVERLSQGSNEWPSKAPLVPPESLQFSRNQGS